MHIGNRAQIAATPSTTVAQIECGECPLLGATITNVVTERITDMLCFDFVVSAQVATGALSRSCFPGVNKSSPMLPTIAKAAP